jgi:hypothetical protein
MSRATDTSLKRMAAADRGDWDEVESLEAAEAAAKPKHKTKKPLSLAIRVEEMEAYDGNPAMRFLISIIVRAMRKAKENYDNTWAPTGWTAEEMVGWCDMAQWRLAQRVGLTEDHVGRMLRQAEAEGFIDIERWVDPDTNMIHARYRVIEEMIDAHQRKEHSRHAKRGGRYAEGSRPSKANGKLHKGMFSKTNQPGMSERRKKIMEQDDETPNGI